jgi:phytoene synthase
VIHRELVAAGVTDPALRRSYDACRRLNAAHGKSYYLATFLLPAAKRPSVHALYGYARATDEIVDDLDPTITVEERQRRLREWSDRTLDGLRAGHSDDALLSAFIDTVRRWRIPVQHVEAFLTSMRRDLTVTRYQTFEDLMAYMDGSAAAIGLQMLPVLEHPGVPETVVAPYARDLGVAFQLSNFLRDVAEDLRRGRIYLPLEDFARFGVDPDDLAAGVGTPELRRLVAAEVARCRQFYRNAAPGVRLLHPTSRECIRTATRLYAGILDEIERSGYDVLTRRARVGRLRRARIALPGLGRAALSRRH